MSRENFVLKIQYGGRPIFTKFEKKSPYLCTGSNYCDEIKFGKISLRSLNPTAHDFFKIRDDGWPWFKNSEHLKISISHQHFRNEIWHVMSRHTLNPIVIWIFKIQNVGRPFLLNHFSYHNNIWQDDAHALYEPMNQISKCHDAWKFDFLKKLNMADGRYFNKKLS